MNERRDPARPGSAIARERAAIRSQVKPGARELFEVFSMVRAVNEAAKAEGVES